MASALSFRSISASSRDSFCQQFGAEAVVTTNKLFVTISPASTFTVKPEVIRGCVIRRKYLSELLKWFLVAPDEIVDCNKDSSTFAYAHEKNGGITVYCVDHIYE